MCYLWIVPVFWFLIIMMVAFGPLVPLYCVAKDQGHFSRNARQIFHLQNEKLELVTLDKLAVSEPAC